jgi:hypothetical protein
MTRYNLRKWKTRHWQASFALLGPLLAAGMVLCQLNRSATIEAARNNYSVEKDVVKSFIDVLKAQSATKAGVVGSDVESELLAFDSTIYIAKDLEGHDVLRKGDLPTESCDRRGRYAAARLLEKHVDACLTDLLQAPAGFVPRRGRPASMTR